MMKVWLFGLGLAVALTACTGEIGELERYQCIDDLDCSLDQMLLELVDAGELPADSSSDDLVKMLRRGGCFVTGIGHVGSDDNGDGISDQPGAGQAGQDSYGGNAMGMKDGRIRGQWQNTTHLAGSKDVFHGQAESLYCWHDGGPGPNVPRAEVNRAIWGGPGLWNHQAGYVFVVAAADYTEGKAGAEALIRDAYAIRIYRDIDADGVATSADELVYAESDCVYGNFQIHPPNNGHPYVPSVLTEEMAHVAGEQELCPDGAW